MGAPCSASASSQVQPYSVNSCLCHAILSPVDLECILCTLSPIPALPLLSGGSTCPTVVHFLKVHFVFSRATTLCVGMLLYPLVVVCAVYTQMARQHSSVISVINFPWGLLGHHRHHHLLEAHLHSTADVQHVQGCPTGRCPSQVCSRLSNNATMSSLMTLATNHRAAVTVQPAAFAEGGASADSCILPRFRKTHGTQKHNLLQASSQRWVAMMMPCRSHQMLSQQDGASALACPSIFLVFDDGHMRLQVLVI